MRKTKTYIVRDEKSRDNGKTFLITEMSALKAEKWATRALLALGKSGADIPDNVRHSGMAGMAALGLRALTGISFSESEPLLDEMLTCVEYIPDPQKNPLYKRPLMDENDIEEVKTLLDLRLEVFALHTNFTSGESLWKWITATVPTPVTSSPTQTSQKQSE